MEGAEDGRVDIDETINPEGLDFRPLHDRPKKVAIVALGQSSHQFVVEQMSDQGLKEPFDEVWTVNRGIRGFQHDKVFCMDDFRWIEKRNPDYAAFLKNSDKPVFTSTKYPDYPNAVEYPMAEVLETIQDDIFAVNTVAYMVAYALHIGVERLSIYGADFIYPNGNTAEAGGQAVAFLLGKGLESGMLYRIPQSSTLLYSDKVDFTKPRPQREWYGYHRKREMAEAEAKKAGSE